MKRKNILILRIVTIFMLTAIIGAVSLFTAPQKESVKAATLQTLYTLTDRNYDIANKEKQFFSAVDGCSYNITVSEDSFTKINRLSFSAYKVWAREDLMRDSDGNITNEISVGKMPDGELIRYENIEVPLVRVEEDHENGYEKIKFKVTAYEWCAFVFYIDYNVDGTVYTEESAPLYCTNIDTVRPSAAISEGPIFKDGGFLYYVNCRGNALGNNSPSQNSGMTKIKVYRTLNGKDETLQTITDFRSNAFLVSVEVLAVKGVYWVEVTDGVGYTTKQKIAQIDYDIQELVQVNQIDERLQKSTLYIDALIDNLRHKYNEWQVLALSAESTEKVIEDARSAALAALDACLQAEQAYNNSTAFTVNIRNMNNFTSSGAMVKGFGSGSYPTVLFGEKAALNVTLSSMKAQEAGKGTLDFTELKNIHTLTTVELDIPGKLALAFKTPVVLEITVPNNYVDAEAYALVELNGKRYYEKLEADKTIDTVNVYATNSHMKIYLVYSVEDAGSFNLNWLYFLLIIPIGAGVAMVAIYFAKKKKKVALIEQDKTTKAISADAEIENDTSQSRKYKQNAGRSAQKVNKNKKGGKGGKGKR